MKTVHRLLTVAAIAGIAFAIDSTTGSTAGSNAGETFSNTGSKIVEDHEGFNSFLIALSMISLSEIGDKTFLIAALMAMRHSALFVLSSAFSSLAIMTVLSGIIGHSFVTFFSERVTSFLAGSLFLVFGYKLLKEGLAMSKDAGVEEEMTAVEEEIAIKDMNSNMNDVENGITSPVKLHNSNTFKDKLFNLAALIFSPLWIEIFMMNFLGELGDRSQISIIAIASNGYYWYSIWGAVMGHLICTGVAVLGGKYLATKISMRTVTLAGSGFFFIFAIVYFYSVFFSVA